MILLFAQETVERLKESLRQLEVEFEVQRKLRKDLEDLKDSLLGELTFLRLVCLRSCFKP